MKEKKFGCCDKGQKEKLVQQYSPVLVRDSGQCWNTGADGDIKSSRMTLKIGEIRGLNLKM